MSETLAQLEQKRKELGWQLSQLGAFRRGTISVNYRRCGRANCACAKPGHPGHGPQYLWNATIGGKSRAKNLRLGPELQKFSEEVENYQRFQQWESQWVAVNEQICLLTPMAEPVDDTAAERLKKKLQKKYKGKSNKK